MDALSLYLLFPALALQDQPFLPYRRKKALTWNQAGGKPTGRTFTSQVEERSTEYLEQEP